MDRTYWIRRNREAMRMAAVAATSESRLIHYELAGRYSVKAASCLPFLLPAKGPATPGEREALRLMPARPDPSPAPALRALRLRRGKRQRPMSMNFKRAKAVPRLSHEEQVRQGKVVNLARAAFADTDRIRDFLNSHHDALQGRPIDLAVASQAGLAAVEAVILAQAPAAQKHG